jgi:hypothetical protein
MRRLLLALLVAMCVAVAAPAADDKLPDWASKATLAARLDDPKQVEQFRYSDPAVWKHGKDADRGFLELAYDRKAYKSTYIPKHRSPVHIAMLAHGPFTDFVLDVEVQSTTEPYGHQDVCLFFGVQSPEKYYYVHLAPAPDANAHNVFIVNAAARKNLLEPQKKGIEWKKDAWHKLRVIRQTESGKIEVYFDDMTKPVLTAEDKTFASGYIGVGSFDDTGRFRNIRIGLGSEYKQKDPDFFKPLGK